MARGEIDSNAIVIRPATIADTDELALVHVASIRDVGAGFYSAEAIAAWTQPRSGRTYAEGIRRGEKIFVATTSSEPDLLGFSWYFRADDKDHTSVYMLARAARRGVGTKLFLAAEEAARSSGATTLDIDASLAAVTFYAANGFVEVGRGEHVLRSGIPIACVHMRKQL